MSGSEHEEEEEQLNGMYGHDSPLLVEKVKAMWTRDEVKPALVDLLGAGADEGNKTVLLERLVGAYFIQRCYRRLQHRQGDD